MFGEWQFVSLLILVGVLGIPVRVLMSRWTSASCAASCSLRCGSFVFHWLDLYWNVMPSYDWETRTMAAEGRVGFTTWDRSPIPLLRCRPVDITVWLALIGVSSSASAAS